MNRSPQPSIAECNFPTLIKIGFDTSHHIAIQLARLGFFGNDSKYLLGGHWAAVRPTLLQRLEDVGDGNDPRFQRQVSFSQVIRVAGAINALVVL